MTSSVIRVATLIFPLNSNRYNLAPTITYFYTPHWFLSNY